jgi:hypothetical protein
MWTPFFRTILFEKYGKYAKNFNFIGVFARQSGQSWTSVDTILSLIGTGIVGLVQTYWR